MPFLRLLLLMGLLATSLLAGCVAEEDESGKRKSRAGEGRDETATIRNTENLGYSGNAIGAKIDTVIETNENRPAELDRRLDEATQSQ